MSSGDAVVIGAGVIGCSVAAALASNGLRTVVVDGRGAAGSASTSASSTVVRFNYSTWEGVVTSFESQLAWRDWAGHLGSVDPAGMARFIRTGGLVLDSPNQDPEAMLARFDAVGIDYERWDAATLAERMPMLSTGRFYPPKPVDDPAFFDDPDGELGAIWVPDYGFVDDASLAAHNLLHAATQHGAQVRMRAAVTGITRSGDRVTGVRLADGEQIDAPVVVNVGGPWSGRVNELAGVGDDFAVTTRPMRSEVHQVPLPAGVGSGEPLPVVVDLDLGTYFRGTLSGEVLVGGTEPECDPLHWLDDPDDYDPNPTKKVFDAQVLRLARRIPELAVPDAPRGVVGVYDVTQDWIPIYDRTALAGYYVAIGTSGNQFKNAPVVGDLVAGIILAERAGANHDTDPVRLRMPRCGHEVNMAHYSRRREIPADGNFNVMA